MKRQILIIDQNETTRSHLKEAFLSMNYYAIEKESLNDAYSFLFDSYKDLLAIIVNNFQDTKEEITILEGIRGNLRLSTIPLFVLLDNDNGMQERLLSYGVEGVFVKPYKIENIIISMKNIIDLCVMTSVSGKFHSGMTSDERLNAIMENVACGIIAASEHDGKYKILFSNDEFYRIVGYTREEYLKIAPTGYNLIDEKDAEMVRKKYQTFENNKRYRLEFRINRKDGKEIWIRQTLNKFKFDFESDIVQISVIDDITSEKEAEEKASNMQMKMRLSLQLIDDSSAAVYVCDARTYELYYVNRSAARLCGKSRDESYGKRCFEYLLGYDRPCPSCNSNKLNCKDFYEREVKSEKFNRFYMKRGKIIDWGGVKARVEYMNDITDRVNAQLKAHENQNAILLASENGGITFWQYDLDTKIQTWGDLKVSDEMGYPNVMENVPDSLVENGDVHPDDANEVLRMYDELFNGAESTTCTVRFYNHKNGKYVWHRVVYTRIHDVKYKTRQAVGFATNVDLLQGIKTRYEKEHQLRDELMKNTIIYYELNLSTNHITEYHSEYDDVLGMQAGTLVSEKMRKKILDRVCDEDKDRVRKTLFSDSLLETYFKGENSVEITYRRFTPNNDIHWVKAVVKIMKEPHAEDIVAFVYIHDVNNEEIDRLALSGVVADDIESLSIIDVKSGMARVIKTDYDLTNIKESERFNHNEAILKVINSRVIESEKQKCIDFFMVDDMVKALEIVSPAELTYAIKDSKGETRWKRATVYYLDKTKINIVLTRRDITIIYEEEQNQKMILKAAADAANEANKAKGEFLSRMSHDMRTPMNAILGMVYLAKSENPSKEISSYLENIDSSSHYLLGLINDVLDLSKIESGNTVLREENYTLVEFARGINTVIQPLMDAKNLDFTFKVTSDATCIIVDKLRFNQIFYNLLTNASKYTPNGGKVEFLMEHGKDKDGKYGLRCYIRDNGIGMSEDFMKIIFTPFSQENNKALAEQQGTGLGLAIVKSLVELTGGSIKVKSKLGVGTEFTLDLYVRRVDNPKIFEEKVKKDYSGLNGMKVLLVEDNEMNITVAEKLLQSKGCIVSVAHNGEEGISAFAASNQGYFDVILMDVRMPVMGGIEATKKIRSLTRGDAATIIIIAMTADAFSIDMENTKDAGMNEHLTKPIDPEILFSTLLKYSRK